MACSTSPSVHLLTKEYKNFIKRPHQFMKAYQLQNDNITEWIVYVVGPPGTLYEGGIFKTLIRFPDSFPIDPPSVQFLSDFYHPNVYRDGKVCISTLQHPIPDYLRDDEDDPKPENASSGFWSPANGTESIFMSVISLLSDPNPDDPANAIAADLYVNNMEAYKKTVKDVVEKSKKNIPADLDIDFEEDLVPSRNLSTVSSMMGIDDCMNSDDEEFDFDSASDDDVNDGNDDDNDDDDDDDDAIDNDN